MGVVVKIEDDIIQSCLWWYRHVLRKDINSQIREVIVRLWKFKYCKIEGSSKEIVGRVCKGFGMCLEKRGCV